MVVFQTNYKTDEWEFTVFGKRRFTYPAPAVILTDRPFVTKYGYEVPTVAAVSYFLTAAGRSCD